MENEQTRLDKMNDFCLQLENKATQFQKENNFLRKGQCLMNCLYVVDEELYAKISNTEADCFYLDSKIPLFYQKLLELTQK